MIHKSEPRFICISFEKQVSTCIKARTNEQTQGTEAKIRSKKSTPRLINPRLPYMAYSDYILNFILFHSSLRSPAVAVPARQACSPFSQAVHIVKLKRRLKTKTISVQTIRSERIPVRTNAPENAHDRSFLQGMRGPV